MFGALIKIFELSFYEVKKKFNVSITKMWTKVFFLMATMWLFAISAIFLGLGTALYIGESIGSNYYGFFIVSVFFAFIALIFFILYKIIWGN